MPVSVLVALVGAAVFFTVDPVRAEAPAVMMLVSGHIIAGVLFLRGPRRSERGDSAAWTALAVALFFGAGGVLLLGALTAFGYDAPAFGPVDLVFLVGYAAMVTGLVKLARRGALGTGWVVTLTDTAVAAVALGTFVWVGLGGDLVDAMAGADLSARIIAPIYPLLDVAVLVGLMAMAIRRTAFRLDPKLIVLAVGLAVQVLADLWFLVEGIGHSFNEVGPRMDLFLLASACYVGVGILAGRPRVGREYPDRDVQAFALMWPYLLGLGVVAMHVISLLRLGIAADELVTLMGAMSVAVLVVIRQTVAIRHARRRVEQQRRELISSVSHEVRTPLTGLIGYLNLLADARGRLSIDECEEMIQIASGEAAHLGTIITDMVAMARDDGQGLGVTMRPTRLADICAVSVERAAVPDVTMSVHSDEEIQADLDRLAQAVANLITNAAKYGGSRVRLEAQSLGDRIEIEVHDDGPGVPVRFQERIWEKFERGTHRFDATTPGMGVGLPIVRAIALAHGGTAEYRRSEQLGGACFVISVPSGVNRVQAERRASAMMPVFPVA